MPTYQSNYQQPMMNMSNPYMERLAQFQSQQNINSFSTLGKIVESEDIVKATDIPMDGNMYYFPKADGSMIYGKQWLANGTTRLIAFKPILDVETNNLPQNEIKSEFDLLGEFKTTFLEQFESVTERLDKIEKAIRPNSSSKSRKEVADE